MTKTTKNTKIAPATNKAALAYAKKVAKQGYGNVTIVRSVTQKFSTLPRKDVLAIAKELRINLGTASRQYQEIRHGNFIIDLPIK